MARNIELRSIEYTRDECSGMRLQGVETDEEPRRQSEFEGVVRVGDILTKKEWASLHHNADCPGPDACAWNS